MEPYIHTVEVIMKEGLFESVLKSYLPTIITLLGIGIGYFQFKKQLNRSMHERRLNEVYSLLYGYIVRQETIRKLYLNHMNIIDVPILTMTRRISKTKIEIMPDGIKGTTEEGEEIVTSIDRKNFIKVLNDTNKGLARPNLLILMNQYEVLIYLEESLDNESEEYGIATTKKVETEFELIKEIVEGYIETINNLQLDKNNDIYDLEYLNK